LKGFPGGCRPAEFGFQQKEPALLEHEIQLKPTRGRKSGAEAKGFLCKSSFFPRSRLAKNNDAFHAGEKTVIVDARSINSAKSPGPPKVTRSDPALGILSAARGQAKRRIFGSANRASERD